MKDMKGLLYYPWLVRAFQEVGRDQPQLVSVYCYFLANCSQGLFEERREVGVLRLRKQGEEQGKDQTATVDTVVILLVPLFCLEVLSAQHHVVIVTQENLFLDASSAALRKNFPNHIEHFFLILQEV